MILVKVGFGQPLTCTIVVFEWQFRGIWMHFVSENRPFVFGDFFGDTYRQFSDSRTSNRTRKSLEIVTMALLLMKIPK